MTDRELLERAAKAAGYTISEWQDPDANALWLLDGKRIINFAPLMDDGDALRLAVRLRMDVYTAVNGCYVEVNREKISEKSFDDPYAATRRAIVRAAAALGEAA